ncbi:MAG TPA: hypothetical protein VIJ20_13625 [Solirubrobacteraceae bacterium]
MLSRGVTKTGKARANLTPAGAIGRGLIAAALGTAAMDALLYSRYRREDGEDSFLTWEFSSGVSSWDDAPAPAHIGKRLFEGLFQREVPVERAGLVNNITHWGYGILGGVQYGIFAGSLSAPRIVYGLPFGATVWATSYVVLPLAHLYEPIWKYDPTTLAKDLSAHLLYGLTTAAAFDLLSRV